MAQVITRRGLLGASVATSVLWSMPCVHATDPEVADPRATDGDERFEPDWDEKLTVTVGVKKADLVGSSDRVLQAAVDYVSRFGGGTVKVLPGTYTLRNAVHLPSGIRIQGERCRFGHHEDRFRAS